MKCLICETPDDKRPTSDDTISEFSLLFGHIVDRFPDDYWAIDYRNDSPFQPLIPDEVESLIETHFKRGVIVGRQLARCMRWIRDLDRSICHLNSGSLFPSIDVITYETFQHIDFDVPSNVKHAFENVDGAYWKLATDDDESIASVKDAWHLTQFLEVSATY